MFIRKELERVILWNSTERRYHVVLWLILFTMWCVDTSCFLGTWTKDEGRKESFKRVLNNHLGLTGLWWNHHAQWLHEDSEVPDSLKVCCATLQLLASAKYELIQQAATSKEHSIGSRDRVKGAKAKCCLFVNCCFYNYNTIKLHIFMGNLRDR